MAGDGVGEGFALCLDAEQKHREAPTRKAAAHKESALTREPVDVDAIPTSIPPRIGARRFQTLSEPAKGG